MIKVYNLTNTDDPNNGRGYLSLEKTLVPNEYVLIDSPKRVFSTGLGRVKIASEVKGGIVRSLFQTKCFYVRAVDGVSQERYVTVGITITGDAEDIRIAEQANQDGLANNTASQALIAALRVSVGLAAGVGAKPGVNGTCSLTGAPDADADGTGLSHADLTVRMKNPVVRAAMGLEPVPDGSTLNGEEPAEGSFWALAQVDPNA